MKFLLTFLLSGCFATLMNAQATLPSTVPGAQPFGKIDKADVEMTACDFEKDANAEVLFDKGSVYYNAGYERVFERHIRVKIFNDNAKGETNVKLRYVEGSRAEYISDLEAETFNLNNGNIEVTKVEKGQIFNQRINKLVSEMVFSFPNVKAGSVVEYKYTLTSSTLGIPNWYFQSAIPTRYSEYTTAIPGVLSFRSLVSVNRPFVKNTPDDKALANIPSLADEPFMSSKKDNADRILYQLISINNGALSRSFPDSWDKIGKELLGNEYFGGQLKRKLTGEDDIINKAKGLANNADKIAYIFNTVRDQVKWDNENSWFTNNGTAEAWDKKTGNTAEINLMVYHLLRRSGIPAFPMLVSTKGNGKVYPSYPNKNQFNKTVTYIPIDSTNYYVLDATNKFNTCNQIPRTLLNGFGLCINPDEEKYDLIFIQRTTPVLQAVSITATIAPDGKMSGSAVINSYSYHRTAAVERYKNDGEKKFITYLRDRDNNLKITGLKLENMDVDTLPLKQSIEFDLAPAVPDDNYIYFVPNMFTRLRNNPFLSEQRLTDIDFEYPNNYLLSAIFKLPAGYKVDALPKNISLTMPDKSITFKRLLSEQDGAIAARYIIDFKKSLYFKEDYPAIREFFKKMYEMLNEQIVLKKS